MSTPTNIHQIPIPNKYEHIHPLKYHPQQCIYTNGSFIPPTKNIEGLIEGNATGSGVYSPNNNTRIAEKLPGYQNIQLRAKLNAIFIAIKNINSTQQDIHIFTYSLNNLYMIHKHIQHPTSQHHHTYNCITSLYSLFETFFCLKLICMDHNNMV